MYLIKDRGERIKSRGNFWTWHDPKQMFWGRFEKNVIAQTFCRFWISRHWPPCPRIHRAGLPGWWEEKDPELQCWCCWALAWSSPPLWWHPWAFEHTRWCSPPSAARSRWILNPNRWEKYIRRPIHTIKLFNVSVRNISRFLADIVQVELPIWQFIFI